VQFKLLKGGIPIKNSSLRYKHTFLGLYLRNLGANVLGFVTVFILNALTPMEFFLEMRINILAHEEWHKFVFLYPLVFIIVAYLQYLIQRPVARMAVRLEKGRTVDEPLATIARQRLINLPFYMAFINFCVYFVVPAMVTTSFHILLETPISLCLFIFFRVFMIGGISAGLSFFLVEDFSRRTLIPSFFPNGRLAEVKGTIRIPISRRIRLLYASGTSIPMVILLGTLFYVAWETNRIQNIGSGELARGIFIFTVALCIIFLIIALRLNFLVQRSIVEPIKAMLSVVENLRSGGTGARIKVVSNDELGIVGDAGNRMVDALEERRRIREAFGKYVNPEIRDEIMAGKIPLEGERREATLLFADLRGFTSYVEGHEPEEVILSMRSYFTAMENAVRTHNGLVLQYVGDEIESVFGVPLHDPDHADRAIRSALEMRRNLTELNRKRELEGKTPFKHGVGIHTGMVLAGITGSEDRLSYALIGDTVNLAARIEDLARDLSCDILVSEQSVRQLKGSYSLERLPQCNVKGYSKPITVYRVA
jgi:class 3 adenylate cyclase